MLPGQGKAGQLGRCHVSEEDRREHPILTRYMETVGGAERLYDVSRAVMGMVQFGQLNLQQSWPMKGKFDVVFCRSAVTTFRQRRNRSFGQSSPNHAALEGTC